MRIRNLDKFLAEAGHLGSMQSGTTAPIKPKAPIEVAPTNTGTDIPSVATTNSEITTAPENELNPVELQQKMTDMHQAERGQTAQVQVHDELGNPQTATLDSVSDDPSDPNNLLVNVSDNTTGETSILDLKDTQLLEVLRRLSGV